MKKNKQTYDKKALKVLVTRQTDIKNGEKTRANHILITGICNNKCVFCFSKKELLKVHFEKDDINKLIKDGYDSGCRILVLSGGEPTIHPDFIDFIEYAKSIGYSYARVITNGRMFAYANFVKKAKKAGLDEVTVSIHSHLSKVQDEMSKTKGSFEQAIRGIRNCKAQKIDIKLNIVVNKKNIRLLKETIEFFFKIEGIKRIGLLRLMPFGRAWDNKEFLFCNNNTVYLQKALEFSKKNEIDIWANRFDLRLFEKYPEYMQTSYKFINEVESRIDEFNDLTQNGKEMYCYPERCAYCFLEDFCKELREAKKKLFSNKNVKKYGIFLNSQKLINPVSYADYYVKNCIEKD